MYLLHYGNLGIAMENNFSFSQPLGFIHGCFEANFVAAVSIFHLMPQTTMYEAEWLRKLLVRPAGAGRRPAPPSSSPVGPSVEVLGDIFAG